MFNQLVLLVNIASVLIGCCLIGCSAAKPVEGPDKVFIGEARGAAEGAGAGAVIGLQVGAGTGPGALIGAGFGAVAGAISGMVDDQAEDNSAKTEGQIAQARKRAAAQQKLSEHYNKRLELHPTRDIFPADVFFNGDSTKLCPSGKDLIAEIARMNLYRLPSSRIVVACYAKAADKQSAYARHLTEKRSLGIVNQLVRAGIEPRRLETRAVVVDQPVLIDPLDNPGRYDQAIEFIPIDR